MIALFGEVVLCRECVSMEGGRVYAVPEGNMCGMYQHSLATAM